MELSDEEFAELQATVQQINIADLSLVLQFMQKCVKCEEGTERSHILADLLMARLLLEACGTIVSKEVGAILEQIGTAYAEGMKERWWFV